MNSIAWIASQATGQRPEHKPEPRVSLSADMLNTIYRKGRATAAELAALYGIHSRHVTPAIKHYLRNGRLRREMIAPHMYAYFPGTPFDSRERTARAYLESRGYTVIPPKDEAGPPSTTVPQP